MNKAELDARIAAGDPYGTGPVMSAGDKYLADKYPPQEDKPELMTGATGAMGRAADKVGGAVGTATQGAKELGGDLWERSWAGAGLRYAIPRVMMPWVDWDEEKRKQVIGSHAENYNISIKEKQDFINNGTLPPTVMAGEKIKEEQEAVDWYNQRN